MLWVWLILCLLVAVVLLLPCKPFESFIAPSDQRTQKLKNMLGYLKFTPTPGTLWTQENAQGLQVLKALLGSTDSLDIYSAQAALKSWGMFTGKADGVVSDAYSQARTKWVASQSSEVLDIIRVLVR